MNSKKNTLSNSRSIDNTIIRSGRCLLPRQIDARSMINSDLRPSPKVCRPSCSICRRLNCWMTIRMSILNSIGRWAARAEKKRHVEGWRGIHIILSDTKISMFAHVEMQLPPYLPNNVRITIQNSNTNTLMELKQLSSTCGRMPAVHGTLRCR